MTKYRILLVDDIIDWLKSHKSMIGNLFGENFFEIDVATNARMAFNKVSQNESYDLIITDLEMEKIFDDGYAGEWLVKNLINNNKCKNTKFLIISGSYDIHDIACGVEASCIPKSDLLNNPLLLKYAVMNLLNLESA